MLSLFLLPAGAGATDARELAARLPAGSPAEREAVMAEFSAGGIDTVNALAADLTEEGGDKDATARTALHGLAVWHGRPGADEAGREEFARDLAASAARQPERFVRRFLVRQLLWTGGEAAGTALAGMVLDPVVGTDALREIQAFGAGGVPALLNAAEGADPDARMRIFTALGRLRAGASVPALLEAARADDRSAAAAAREALAEIGDGRAATVLLKAAKRGRGDEGNRATTAFLRLAERIAEEGDPVEAGRLYETVLKGGHWRAEPQARIRALDGLARVRGAGAHEWIRRAAIGDEPDLADAARRIAAGVSGREGSRRWIALAGSGDPVEREAALDVLGRRDNPEELAALIAGIRDPNPGVRRTASRGLGVSSRAEAVTPLRLALGDVEKDVRDAARAALVFSRVEGVDSVITEALDGESTAVRAALLEILTARAAFVHLPVIVRETGSTESAVRLAALAGVGALGGRDELDGLLAHVLRRDADGAEREAAVAAALAICRRQPDSGPCVDLWLKVIRDATDPGLPALLAALPKLGGQRCLKAARDHAAHGAREVREAAVRALADWPGLEPAEDLMKLAEGADSLKVRVLALRGVVRMAEQAGSTEPAKAVPMIERALAAATRPEETRLALGGVSKIGEPAALELAGRFLEDPLVATEAAAAVLGVVAQLAGTARDRTLPALDRVLGSERAESLHERARAMREDLQQRGDFIRAWMVAGPYTDYRKDDHELLGAAFPPETAERTAWRPFFHDPESKEPWKADLGVLFNWEDHCVAYLRTIVVSDRSREAVLELGHDDGVKVWLNGKVVHRFDGWRGGVEPGEDKVPVELKKGANRLMLKVFNRWGGWGACARFADAAGGALEGLTVERR